jgi:hypothetical protein
MEGRAMFRTIATIFGLCLVAVSAEAALQGRAPATPGGTDYRAYYDTTTNLTWVADANLAATNTFGAAGICTDNITPCHGAGTMTWDIAQTWIVAMNAAGYLGGRQLAAAGDPPTGPYLQPAIQSGRRVAAAGQWLRMHRKRDGASV